MFEEAINAIKIREQSLIERNHLEKWSELDAKEVSKLQDALAFLKIANIGGLGSLVQLVREWGNERNITGPNAKATVETQFSKLLEEVDEIREGIEKKDQHEIIDGIGDATVVLILLASLAGVRFETCLLAAYDEIRNRKGKMVEGKFVKEA